MKHSAFLITDSETVEANFSFSSRIFVRKIVEDIDVPRTEAVDVLDDVVAVVVVHCYIAFVVDVCPTERIRA